MPLEVTASEITRRSKSNLALGFVSLGKERRRDITIFYAFCRLIDDLVDDPSVPIVDKQKGLNTWRQCLRREIANEPPLAPEVRDLIARYSLAPEMLDEIIAGVEMDLTITRYDTFEQLRVYCYGVASAVGLVSIEIFGYRDPKCRDYAVALGLALQLTNIIRDVDKDLANGRVYLPHEDMVRFNYGEAELRARTHNAEFRRLMQFEAARAREFYRQAAELLPRADRRAMLPAEIMASIYRALLRKIERDSFRVFDRDYRLSSAAKAGHVVLQMLKPV